MSEESGFSQGDDLSSILGDDIMVENKEEMSNNNMSEGLKIYSQKINSTLPEIKTIISKSLGQEIDMSIGSIEESKGISASDASEWYCAKGSISNGTAMEHVFAFPINVAKQIVVQYAGVDDVSDALEEISGPLVEFSQTLMDVFLKSYGIEYKGTVGNFEKTNDLSAVNSSDNFFKVKWVLGGESFYEFTDAKILSLEDEAKSIDINDAVLAASTESTESLLGAMSDIASPSINIDSNAHTNGFGFSDDDDSISLGDSLLGSQSISDVSFPSFDNDISDSTSHRKDKGSNSINLLMDVMVDVTVELGSTKKLVGDILELNRGSIIELRKLAGEPLDIKVNNKLIARGEVVVIDEYFGVRIIEIVSPYEKVDVNKS